MQAPIRGGNARMNRRFLQWLVAPALVAGLAATGVAAAAVPASDAARASRDGQEARGRDAQRLGLDVPAGVRPDARSRRSSTSQPDVTVNYAGGGSGKGRRTSPARSSQCAGSDAPYPGGRPRQGQGRHVPLLPDRRRADHGLVQPLRREEAPALRRARSPRSSRATITKWNDPAIAADNPKRRRCRARRSPSPTAPTARARPPNFTKYLTKAAPTAWKLGTDKTVDWPARQPGRQRQRRCGARS